VIEEAGSGTPQQQVAQGIFPLRAEYQEVAGVLLQMFQQAADHTAVQHVALNPLALALIELFSEGLQALAGIAMQLLLQQVALLTEQLLQALQQTLIKHLQ